MARRQQPTQTDLQTLFITSKQSNWIKDLHALLRVRESEDAVRIRGPKDFFYGLLEALFAVYDVKVLDSDDSENGRQTLSIITNPRIEERLDDMPSIIAFFFREKIHKLRESNAAHKKVPNLISGVFLYFLLRFPFWKDFNALRSYIHQAVAWSLDVQAINLDVIGHRLAHICAISPEAITNKEFQSRTSYEPIVEHDYELDDEWGAAYFYFANNNYLCSRAAAIYVERTSPNVSEERPFGDERLFSIDDLHRTCKAIQCLGNLEVPVKEIKRIEVLDWRGEDVVTPLESKVPDLKVPEDSSIYSQWREACHNLGISDTHTRREEKKFLRVEPQKLVAQLKNSGRTIEYDNKEFTFTARQAPLIRVLHDNYVASNDFISEQDVLERADKAMRKMNKPKEATYSKTRFEDIFKSRWKMFEEITEKHPDDPSLRRLKFD